MENILEKLEANDRISITDKINSCEVFSFGRDHGHFGRILNQTVISKPSLNLKNGTEFTGFCFTPQDGNSLLSSISIANGLCILIHMKRKFNALSLISLMKFN